MREARFCRPGEEGRMECLLCPHRCVIAAGKRGICGVRENREGCLYSLVYGKLIAANLDPIEKKPLFHFLPGAPIYSVATLGCNLSCRHCQNADISQVPADRVIGGGRPASPEEVVEAAVRAGSRAIAYTYTEPTIFYEYAFDIGRLAKEKGMKNVFVTNGYIEEEPQRELSGILDAANVDLKSFSDDFYRKICGGRLEPVLEAITRYREMDVWIEITTLLIPGLNDSEEELRSIARFIAGLGIEIPWHVSRYHPTYRMTDRPGTPEESLERAARIGVEEGLLYVYRGNVPGGPGEDTDCPGCGRPVIRRTGFRITGYDLQEGRCSSCGTTVHGVGL
jgi:pyruvate formate lyase activating enzyme